MRGAGNFENENTNQTRGKNQNREKGGLIPITAKILNEISITSEETMEYQGVQLYDVYIVGNLFEVEELGSKSKMKIWDHTGIADIIFYQNNELATSQILQDFGNNP